MFVEINNETEYTGKVSGGTVSSRFRLGSAQAGYQMAISRDDDDGFAVYMTTKAHLLDLMDLRYFIVARAR